MYDLDYNLCIQLCIQSVCRRENLLSLKFPVDINAVTNGPNGDSDEEELYSTPRVCWWNVRNVPAWSDFQAPPDI